jgi:NADH-quinone oxidoreductase subunit N
MGLSNASTMGAQAVGYYLLAYMVSNLAVFFVVVVVSKTVGDELDDYDGLAKRSPFLAAALFIGLLSLAGVPPLAGFSGKLLVLLATVQSGRLWLVGIGGAMVAVSLYYYLMVVRRMYLRQPSSAAAIPVDGLTRLAIFLLLGGILAVGTVQEPFLRLFASAIRF